jgi:hypothetical protein
VSDIETLPIENDDQAADPVEGDAFTRGEEDNGDDPAPDDGDVSTASEADE